MALRRKQNRFNKRLIIGLLALVILLIAGFVGYKIYQSRKRQQTTIIPTTPTKNTNSYGASGNTSKQTPPAGGFSSSDLNKDSGSSNSGNSSGPIKPYGNFVSNHKPGQNGSGTTEDSICNTSPGATCYIEFTKDSIVKKLELKTTDSNGTAMWSWNVKDAGLTAGSWQVSAVAALNGQTASTQDSIPLEISP